MKRPIQGTRLALAVLAALLALPLTPTASPVEGKKRSRTVIRTFSNVVPITLPSGPTPPSPVSAGYYPSDIAVAGLKGGIRDVNVRLNGLSHAYPGQVEVLLVGPRGQTAVVLAGTGGDADVSNVTLTLDDEAPIRNAGPLTTGAFRPLPFPGSPIAFNAPAPAGTSGSAALSVFDGGNPNGTWRLFAQDAYGPLESGAFGGGWELEITTKVKGNKKR